MVYSLDSKKGVGLFEIEKCCSVVLWSVMEVLISLAEPLKWINKVVCLSEP